MKYEDISPPAGFPSLTRLTSGPPELPYCKKTNTERKSKEKCLLL